MTKTSFDCRGLRTLNKTTSTLTTRLLKVSNVGGRYFTWLDACRGLRSSYDIIALYTKSHFISGRTVRLYGCVIPHFKSLNLPT